MLRVVEQAHRTDTGRQRNANEDAYFARGPLFAVADGMGGAQAGEVASRLAAESFEPVKRGEESPEAYLRAIARTANARIHRLAQADSSRSGMGTTLTAALVEDDEVSFAHVGDSRAYVFRDGELKLLTSDHSLVEELRRQGRLTDEQAEDHPQRSIITRALGPEREVEVDTMTYRARPGDVYLLCSDGLTTMVREERIAATVASSESLDDAVSSLVREANEAGGRDNITVVAFRVEEAEREADTKEVPTLIGPAAEEAGLTAGAMAEAAARQTAKAGEGAARPSAAARPPRRWPRRLVMSLVAVAVLASARRCSGLRPAPGVLPRHRLQRPRGALPRPSVRAAAGDRALYRGLRGAGPGQRDPGQPPRQRHRSHPALPRRRGRPARGPPGGGGAPGSASREGEAPDGQQKAGEGGARNGGSAQGGGSAGGGGAGQ